MKWRRLDVAAAILAVAVAIGLVVVATMAGPASSEVATGAPAAAASQHRSSVLFIGDSYTGGSDVPEMSYGCMAAVRMGWLCSLAAIPGTGYVSGGPANRFVPDKYSEPSTSLYERIPHVALKYDPDVVVLDGGRNDLFAPRRDVLTAMEATLVEARRTWPAAKIIMIRPRFLAHPGDDLGFDDQFMSAIDAVADAQNVVVIDPISALVNTDTSRWLAADRIHPNRQGELELAAGLLRTLKAQAMAPAS
jgi:lysophospholipase L1-like esterase